VEKPDEKINGGARGRPARRIGPTHPRFLAEMASRGHRCPMAREIRGVFTQSVELLGAAEVRSVLAGQRTCVPNRSLEHQGNKAFGHE
jgi:hypothetical protein